MGKSIKNDTTTKELADATPSTKTPLVKRLEQITSQSGWRVKRKFQASAAFFVPFENGKGWNTTAGVDSGGFVRLG